MAVDESVSEPSKRPLRILHLEDVHSDALLIEYALRQSGAPIEVIRVATAAAFQRAIEKGGLDLILSDNGVPGLSAMAALEMARAKCPDAPFLLVSGISNEAQILAILKAGATDFVSKDKLSLLASKVRALAEARERKEPEPRVGDVS